MEMHSGAPAALIRSWLEKRLAPAQLSWLDEAAASADQRALERAMALATRKLGALPLSPSDAELSAAEAAHPGWRPENWSVADAARTLLLLAHTADAEAFGETVKVIARTADVPTLVAIYRATPLLPPSTGLEWQIGEGLRTSIRDVFEAIAHGNPLPAASFSEHRWNHMVLKALFIDSTLAPIVGLDQRRNGDLAATLVDHVHERRAAGRRVDLQVWRCIAPFATGQVLDDLRPLIESADPAERLAAALCLRESPDPRARDLLTAIPEQAAVASGAASWQSLAA
jgi:hypothetical protein